MKSRHLVFSGCVLLVCLWTSCGRSLGTAAVASSGSLGYESIPTTPVVEGMKVRPDVLTVSFAFRQESEGLEQALPALKAAVDGYKRATAEAAKAEVTVRMQGIGLESGKVRSNDALAHGVLEVPLPESLDFWGRASLAATLVRVGNKEDAAAEKANAGLRATFGFPVAQVRDPEARRAELMTRWVERTRAFMSLAQSERAPLQVIGCEPPGEVQQHPVSVDEVVLSLPVSCRLEATPGK